MKDWFRRTEWSAEIEKEFFARLARSRSNFHKSQYLRIQAVHLADTGDPDLARVAIRLLGKLFAEYPDDSQLASAYWQRARCYERLGHRDEALADFQCAIETERQLHSMQTPAPLDFAWLVITHRLEQYYDAAQQCAAEYESPFPVDAFRRSAIMAFIAAARGEGAATRRFAREALDAADRRESGLRYHQTLGLVGEQYAEIVEQLRRWAVA